MSRPHSATPVARAVSPCAPPAQAQQRLDLDSAILNGGLKFGEASVYRSHQLERRARGATMQARTDQNRSSLDAGGAPNVRRAAPRTVRPP